MKKNRRVVRAGKHLSRERWWSASTPWTIDGISAEFVRWAAWRWRSPVRYAVIVDRISHDVPFYRRYLKNAVLTGTQVINNPFWWSRRR